jgi:hypothetical protein
MGSCDGAIDAWARGGASAVCDSVIAAHVARELPRMVYLILNHAGDTLVTSYNCNITTLVIYVVFAHGSSPYRRVAYCVAG